MWTVWFGVLMAVVFPFAQRAHAQTLPRWFADVSVGNNSVLGNGEYGHSGVDAAVGVGVRMQRSATTSLLAATTVHVARASTDFMITCLDVPGAACYVTPAVLPFTDVLVGAEVMRKYVGLRAFVGASAHRTDARPSTWIWGTQLRADAVIPATRRVAGVLSFRYTPLTEGGGNRIFVQGFSAGIRVQ